MATNGHQIPKLIVFDLDETLWPWDVNGRSFQRPYRKNSEGKVVDKRGKVMEPYPGVHDLLRDVHSRGFKIAVASRTTLPEGSRTLLELYGWNPMISFQEIYPGSKITHFTKIQKDSGIPFEEMLFLDNEHRNIRDVSTLGVTCILVDPTRGATVEDLDKGLKVFQEKVQNNS